MEGVFDFDPNVENFFLTLGSRRWYVVGDYVPPNDAPAIHCIEQALYAPTKGMEIILIGYLNTRLREP